MSSTKTKEELEAEMFLDELEVQHRVSVNFYKRWQGKKIPIEAGSPDNDRLNRLQQTMMLFTEQKDEKHLYGLFWKIALYRKASNVPNA